MPVVNLEVIPPDEFLAAAWAENHHYTALRFGSVGVTMLAVNPQLISQCKIEERYTKAFEDDFYYQNRKGYSVTVDSSYRKGIGESGKLSGHTLNNKQVFSATLLFLPNKA